MLHLPAVCEIIELSDTQTGFRGGRPNRPYLCHRQFPPTRVAVVPLSRKEESPRSDFMIPVSAAYGLDYDSYIVDWPTTVDYLDAVDARSLGHVRPPEFCEQILQHLRELFSA